MKSDLALLRNVRSGRTPGFTLRAAPPTWTSSFSSVLRQIWVLPKTLFYRTIEALLSQDILVREYKTIKAETDMAFFKQLIRAKRLFM